MLSYQRVYPINIQSNHCKTSIFQWFSNGFPMFQWFSNGVSSLRFNSCGFPKPIMATLFSLGFAAPTPIQVGVADTGDRDSHFF